MQPHESAGGLLTAIGQFLMRDSKQPMDLKGYETPGQSMKAAELALYGPIGDDFEEELRDGETVLTAASLRSQLPEDGSDLTLRINSPGGVATEGAAMYALLSQYEGKVTAYVDGFAASAASLVLMGADEIVMSEGSILMIHDPAAITIGDEAEHRASADRLSTLATEYANVYAKRSGKDVEEIRQLMRDETFMGAQKAVEMGFADRAEGKDKPVEAKVHMVRRPDGLMVRMMDSAKPKKVVDEKTVTLSGAAAQTDPEPEPEPEPTPAPAAAGGGAGDDGDGEENDPSMRAAEIADLCASVGMADRTAEMIRSGKGLDEVRAELREARKSGSAPDPSHGQARETKMLRVDDVYARWNSKTKS